MWRFARHDSAVIGANVKPTTSSPMMTRMFGFFALVPSARAVPFPLARNIAIARERICGKHLFDSCASPVLPKSKRIPGYQLKKKRHTVPLAKAAVSDTEQ
jgi:hypothetical protein